MKLWYSFILIFSAACSYFLPSSPRSISARQEKHYQVTFSHPDWKNVKSYESDYLFQHHKSGDILMVNSFCREFQTESLKKLAHRSFRDVEQVRIIEEKEISFHQRSAYRIKGEGKVDGVLVSLNLLNLRRDHCYFDFLSISSKKKNSGSEADFENFLSSVRFSDEK